MSNMNQIASDLYKAITESDSRKPKPYDTKAEVQRVEGNTVWVKIPGGDSETPVQRTDNANIGDAVMVRVSGGRAWLLGNNTNPATDDARANQAYDVGTEAGEVANIAINEANRARDAADAAETEASRANQAASQAVDAAGEAQNQATIAHSAATNAIDSLSTVQDVLGVVDWVSKHGSYKPSTDLDVIEGKYYFEYISGDGSDDNPYVYELVTNPTGSPKNNGYYEIDTLEQAMANFILARLALTDAGLWVQGSTSDGRALFSPNSVDIYDANRGKVASFGQVITLGSPETHLAITSLVMQYLLNSKVMATFGYDDLFKSYGITVENVMIKGAGNALRLDNNVQGTNKGQYILETRKNGHLSLKPGLKLDEEE